MISNDVSLHKNATTTPAIRARIAASDEPAVVLAARYGVSNLNALRPKTSPEPHKTFKSYASGYLHVDVKYLASKWPMRPPGPSRRLLRNHLPGNGYLFVAIDPLPGR